MTHTHTHTYVTMEISPEAFEEIRLKLLQAGYEHAVLEQRGGPVLDMHGIALQAAAPEETPE